MTDILVYDTIGNVVNSISISDNLQYVDGRVYKGDNAYYKGVGVPYTSHNTDLQVSDEYDIISESPIFYLGTQVSKKCFQGKVGIFQEKFQPQFTDWIGSCGIKELNILENLYDEPSFEKNSIDVLGYETIDESAQQYYLKVIYHCDRVFYMQRPQPQKLRELLDYMIMNNWNFPWDKNSISDISYNGLVTDVADIFNSNELMHKIGTVYSVLYSLHNSSYEEYNTFCELNGLIHNNSMDIVFNSMYLLAMNGVDINPFIIGNGTDTYKNIIMNYLVVGKNCGFCGVGSCKNRTDTNQSYGEFIRQGYINRVGKMLNIST
jgi:hypothetical protein